MHTFSPARTFMPKLSRRLFVQGLAGGAALVSCPRRLVWGAAAATGDGSVLVGPEFDLTIGETSVNYTGRQRTATAVNGRVPAPLLRMRQGDTVTIRVTNRLRVRSSIHWHGFIVPADMDGVPGLSFAGIDAGSTFVYRFKVKQSGTYWYHSHSRFQEQTGLYGPVIIDPAGGERHLSDREHVVLLSDWSDADPEWIYATLKRQSDYFNFGKRTVGNFFADARRWPRGSHLGPRHVGKNAHGPDRSRRRRWRHLHVPHEWGKPCGQLDRPLQRG